MFAGTANVSVVKGSADGGSTHPAKLWSLSFVMAPAPNCLLYPDADVTVSGTEPQFSTRFGSITRTTTCCVGPV